MGPGLGGSTGGYLVVLTSLVFATGRTHLGTALGGTTATTTHHVARNVRDSAFGDVAPADVASDVQYFPAWQIAHAGGGTGGGGTGQDRTNMFQLF